MTDFVALTPAEERDLRRLRIVQKQRQAQEVGKAMDRARIRTCRVLREYAVPRSQRRYKWLAGLADREARALTRYARRDGALRWLDLLTAKLAERLGIARRG